MDMGHGLARKQGRPGGKTIGAQNRVENYGAPGAGRPENRFVSRSCLPLSKRFSAKGFLELQRARDAGMGGAPHCHF
jgi:hypothetical protein